MPLEIIGAMTQKQIGYMIESILDTVLMEIGVNGEQQFVMLITYVVVDENDSGFQNPNTNNTECDAVVIATPIDLNRIIKINKPNTRVYYNLQEIGRPNFDTLLADFVKEHKLG